MEFITFVFVVIKQTTFVQSNTSLFVESFVALDGTNVTYLGSVEPSSISDAVILSDLSQIIPFTARFL